MKPTKEQTKIELFSNKTDLRLKVDTSWDRSIRRLITANAFLNLVMYKKILVDPKTKERYTNPKYVFDVLIPAIGIQNTNVTSGQNYPYSIIINLNPYIEDFYVMELEQPIEMLANKWGTEKHLVHADPSEFIWKTLELLELPFNVHGETFITNI